MMYLGGPHALYNLSREEQADAIAWYRVRERRLWEAANPKKKGKLPPDLAAFMADLERE